MWAAIWKFILANQASIIVSLVIGTLFFVLGPLGLWFSGKKVKREKINKAKSEFLDLVESMLVNKEDITISKLLTLYGAIERQNEIRLDYDADIQDLLEDLTLRFARSKHLSPEQKNEYSTQIDQIIGHLNEPPKNDDEEKRELPKSLKSILSETRVILDSEVVDRELIKTKLDSLEKHYYRPNEVLFSAINTIIKNPKLFIAVIILYIIIISAVIYFTGW